MTRTQALRRVWLLLNAIEPLAIELNKTLAALPERDPAHREEPVWNLHSLSGGLLGTVRRMRDWCRRAEEAEG